MSLFSTYPLDPSHVSLFTKLRTQPYPAVPHGLGLSDAAWQASLHPASVAAVSVVYILAVHRANHARLRNGPARDLVTSTYGLSSAVLAHNAFLCLYSLWTAQSMIRHLAHYFAQGTAAGGAAGWTAAFCSVPMYAASSHTPSLAPLGLIAWLFYLSKGYEVVDSIILVLKGKKVSNLQSYHHAGAMWTMWAGVRYSATPIQLFASWNAIVHTAMYFFYSLTCLKLKVPRAAKQLLTTMQITQLVLGWCVAMSYLVVTYRPSAFPNMALPSVGVPAGLQASSFLGRNATAAAASMAGKDTALFSLSPFPSDSASIHAALSAAADAQGGRVPCVASTGAVFAVYLNLLYLLPLIVLFVRFYLRSYFGWTPKRDAAAAKKAQ